MIPGQLQFTASGCAEYNRFPFGVFFSLKYGLWGDVVDEKGFLTPGSGIDRSGRKC